MENLGKHISNERSIANGVQVGGGGQRDVAMVGGDVAMVANWLPFGCSQGENHVSNVSA